MKDFKVISNSVERTKEIASKLAKYLKKGNVVIITGELGAGKTNFVQGFLESFNLEEDIISPTYNIVNEYTSAGTPVYHFDAYKLQDAYEFLQIGGEEYLEKGSSIIEWRQLILSVLPKEYIQIKMSKSEDDVNSRNLEFIAYGDSEEYMGILDKLKEELD